MGTRGYVGVFDPETKTIEFYYNSHDSYPSYLLKLILEDFSPSVIDFDEEDVFSIIQEDFYELIEKAKKGQLITFNGFDNDTSLFIEYIYIIDYNKKCVYCFENVGISDKYYYSLFAIIPENLFEIFVDRVIDFLEEILTFSNIDKEYYRDVVMHIFGTVDFREIDENKIKDILLAEAI